MDARARILEVRENGIRAEVAEVRVPMSRDRFITVIGGKVAKMAQVQIAWGFGGGNMRGCPA